MLSNKSWGKYRIWHIALLLLATLSTVNSFFIIKPEKNISAVNELIDIFEKRIGEPRKNILREMNIERVKELQDKTNNKISSTTVITTTTELPRHFLDDSLFEDEFNAPRSKKKTTVSDQMHVDYSDEYYDIDDKKSSNSYRTTSMPQKSKKLPHINNPAAVYVASKKMNLIGKVPNSTDRSNLFHALDMKLSKTNATQRPRTRIITESTNEDEEEIDEVECFTEVLCQPTTQCPKTKRTTVCWSLTTGKNCPKTSSTPTNFIPYPCGDKHFSGKDTPECDEATSCCTGTRKKTTTVKPTCTQIIDCNNTKTTSCTSCSPCACDCMATEKSSNLCSDFKTTPKDAQANISISFSIDKLEPFLRAINSSSNTCDGKRSKKVSSKHSNNYTYAPKMLSNKYKAMDSKIIKYKRQTTRTTRTRKSLKNKLSNVNNCIHFSDSEDEYDYIQEDTKFEHKRPSTSSPIINSDPVNTMELKSILQSLIKHPIASKLPKSKKARPNLKNGNEHHGNILLSRNRANKKNRINKNHGPVKQSKDVPSDLFLDVWKEDLLRPFSYPRNLESVGRRIYDAALAVKTDLESFKEGNKKLKEEESLIRKGIKNLRGIMSECSNMEGGLEAAKSDSLRKLKELLEVTRVRNHVENKITFKIQDILQLTSNDEFNKLLRSM